MKTVDEFLAEASVFKAPAEREYFRLKNLAGTVGSHKGAVRVVYNHQGGQLKRSMVYDHDTGYTHRNGKHFAMHYSAKPGHNVYVHAHFKGHVPKDVDSLEKEITNQNPHTAGTGHARSLALDIMKHHHGK